MTEGKRVLVLVPHQDDEVIGMGGQVALACRRAASVHVVLITDGAADAGCRCIRGEAPCLYMAPFGEQGDPGRAAHDSALIEGADGRPRHLPATPPAFAVSADADRAPGFSCDGWGRQRAAEFVHVCRALGVPEANVVRAYWDDSCPEHVKDGQIAREGIALTPDAMRERYARVAAHYMALFSPAVVFTMAPYEFAPPPNDHWAVAHGVADAARRHGNPRVCYFHSGVHYRHVRAGGNHLGRRLELPSGIWAVKRHALAQYMRWDPAGGWYATALHSVPATFDALLSGGGRYEYVSDRPDSGPAAS